MKKLDAFLDKHAVYVLVAFSMLGAAILNGVNGDWWTTAWVLMALVYASIAEAYKTIAHEAIELVEKSAELLDWVIPLMKNAAEDKPEE